MANRNIGLNLADNGYRLSWTEEKVPAGASGVTPMSYEDHEEVYGDNESDKVWSKFHELHGRPLKKKEEEAKSE